MYLTGLCRKKSIMDNALVPGQATDWSISLKPGSYTGDTKLQGNLAEFTFAQSSGIVTRDREKDWPIADRRDLSNNPRNNRGSNFFSNKIPFSFLKRRITQLITALLCWVKGERLSYAFYSHFRKKFPWLSKNYWIKVFQYNGWWQVIRNCESGIDVFHPSWLCNELVTLVDGGFVNGHSALFN